MPSATIELSPSAHLSRRTLLRWAAFSAGSAAVLPPIGFATAPALAQEPKSAKGELAPLNRFSRMAQEWFVAQVRMPEAKIKGRLAALTHKRDRESPTRPILCQ